MDPGHLLRRLVHMCTPAFLVYYWLPDPLWPGGVARPVVLLALLAAVLAAEGARLYFGPRIIGLRDYEHRRLSAAAWSGLALAFTFAFFPIELAAPALFGMGWVDPLIGELRVRRSRLYPTLPAAAYFVIVLCALAYFRGLTAPAVLASAVATVLALPAEGLKSELVDDDFLMVVVPLLGMAAAFWVFSG